MIYASIIDGILDWLQHWPQIYWTMRLQSPCPKPRSRSPWKVQLVYLIATYYYHKPKREIGVVHHTNRRWVSKKNQWNKWINSSYPIYNWDEVSGMSHQLPSEIEVILTNLAIVLGPHFYWSYVYKLSDFVATGAPLWCTRLVSWRPEIQSAAAFVEAQGCNSWFWLWKRIEATKAGKSNNWLEEHLHETWRLEQECCWSFFHLW